MKQTCHRDNEQIYVTLNNKISTVFDLFLTVFIVGHVAICCLFQEIANKQSAFFPLGIVVLMAASLIVFIIMLELKEQMEHLIFRLQENDKRLSLGCSKMSDK